MEIRKSILYCSFNRRSGDEVAVRSLVRRRPAARLTNQLLIRISISGGPLLESFFHCKHCSALRGYPSLLQMSQ